MIVYIFGAITTILGAIGLIITYIINREKIKSFMVEKGYTIKNTRYIIRETTKTIIKTIPQILKKRRVRAELIDIIQLQIKIIRDISWICYAQQEKLLKIEDKELIDSLPSDNAIEIGIQNINKGWEKLEKKLETIKDRTWKGIPLPDKVKISRTPNGDLITQTLPVKHTKRI